MRQLEGRDSVFLAMETPDVHCHVGGLTIVDPSEAPGFSFGQVKATLAERIHLAPKFSWKLEELPFGIDRPYWVEDPEFDVARHMHRIAIPSPGGMRELSETAAMLSTRQLDRRRPLWEIWYIEGMADGRIAMLMKAHHCMSDGVGGANLGALLCDLEPNPPVGKGGSKVKSESADKGSQPGLFALRALAHLASAPFEMSRYTAQALRRGFSFLPYLSDDNAPPLPKDVPHVSFNQAVGPNRSFAWSAVSLKDVKKIKDQLGVKVNDLLLELSGSALRRYLDRRDELPEESLVAVVPISLRCDGDGELGNQVSNMSVSWATDVADPLERLRQIHLNSNKAKELHATLAESELGAIGDAVPPFIINWTMRSAKLVPIPVPGNAVVSTVPGPPFPLYTSGARIEHLYPISVLGHGIGLNITAVTYMDRIDFGFTVDPDLVEDPWELAKGIPAAMKELKAALRRERSNKARRGKKQSAKKATASTTVKKKAKKKVKPIESPKLAA